MKKIIISSFILFALVIIACTEDNEMTNQADGFDRTQLTNAWVKDLWLPAINDLKTELAQLNTHVNTFVATPSVAHLKNVRSQWLSAYKVWQHVHVFSYGALNADKSTGFASDMNMYPVDIDQIKANIISKNEAAIVFERNDDAQGFPAIDYLINGLAATDAEIVTQFQDENYQKYLTFLTRRMSTLTQEQINFIKTIDLNSVGNGSNTFFSEQINDIVQYTERAFRENKIATPSGTRQRKRSQVQIDNGVNISVKPEAVEARFSSKNSKALYLEAYTAVKNVYFGRKYKDGSNTTGIQDYLQFLGTTIMVDDKDEFLDSYIVALFGKIDTANNNLTDNFYEQTQDYNINFDATFDAIQEYVEALKGNTLSAFNITIDFADNDGD